MVSSGKAEHFAVIKTSVNHVKRLLLHTSGMLSNSISCINDIHECEVVVYMMCLSVYKMKEYLVIIVN